MESSVKSQAPGKRVHNMENYKYIGNLRTLKSIPEIKRHLYQCIFSIYIEYKTKHRIILMVWIFICFAILFKGVLTL